VKTIQELFALLDDDKGELLRRSAELGYAYAQALMAGGTKGEDRFLWAEKAAAKGDRDGFYWLGFCYAYGAGCSMNVERAKENSLIAAELGHVDSMTRFGGLLDETNPQRFIWLGRAAARGNPYSPFLSEMVHQIELFISGIGNASVMFAIGVTVKSHIPKKGEIFGIIDDVDSYIGPAYQAVQFYNFQLHSYRQAVDSWTLVGIRNGVVKDIRIMIAKLVWESREEAKYEKEK
jgi:hypothetical protein